MPRYRVIRLYDVAGWIETIIEAPNSESARTTESELRDSYTLVPNTPQGLRLKVEEMHEEIELVEELEAP
jgi:hypothetical protein